MSAAAHAEADVSVNVVVVAVAFTSKVVDSSFAVQAGAVVYAEPNVTSPVVATPPVPTVTRPASSAPAIDGVVPKPEVIVGAVPAPKVWRALKSRIVPAVPLLISTTPAAVRLTPVSHAPFEVELEDQHPANPPDAKYSPVP